jgi:hypothetical protein
MAEQSIGAGAGAAKMSYEEFAPQCEARFLAAANQIRDGLIAAGLAANRVTVSEPNTTDLRVQLQATGAGNRTLLAYLELTDSLHLGQTVPGQAIITVYLEGNGSPIATQYIAGNVLPYTDPAGIDSLLTKLGEAEAAIPDLITKARAFLRL